MFPPWPLTLRLGQSFGLSWLGWQARESFEGSGSDRIASDLPSAVAACYRREALNAVGLQEPAQADDVSIVLPDRDRATDVRRMPEFQQYAHRLRDGLGLIRGEL